MLGIVRLYQDTYGDNMGSRTFCQLSKFFGGILITNNKKIQALKEYKQITYPEATKNIKKFTKIMVYNTKPNMFGGVAPKHMEDCIRLILACPEVYFYNCDPILDLQKSVPDSHEHNAPGLTKVIDKLNYFGKRLDRTNCDLTYWLATKIDQELLPINKDNKRWVGCYFGNARQPYRQKQVNELLAPLPSKLIIGHEHEEFPWFDYTPDFYNKLDEAWVTPIIGDQKLHYDTGIPSLRLYEAWHTSTVTLLDARYTKAPDELDERFFFKTPEEFHTMANLIARSPGMHTEMVNIQRKALKSILKKGNKPFDWKKVAKQKEVIKKQAENKVKEEKQKVVDKATERLRKKNLI